MITIDCTFCGNAMDDCAIKCVHCSHENENRKSVSLLEAIISKDERRIANIKNAMKDGQIVRII